MAVIKSLLTTSILAVAAVASAQSQPPIAQIQCPVVFNGQIPKAAKLTDFDSKATSPFNPDYVRGNDSWSEILKFNLDGGWARFDNPYLTKGGLEVTINDRSIFKTQYGFRRAGLQFQGDVNDAGPGNTGVKTLHWSVRQDPSRPLNLTHEYLNVWHEAGDYSGNHINFEMGNLIGKPNYPIDTFKFLNRKNEVIWSVLVDFSGRQWQNFAVTLDYDNNTIQIYYSLGTSTPLKPVFPEPLPNDNSGYGQFQIGMLKKPTGTDDVVNSGYQESGIDEGQIYGALFVEDSKGGCVSL